MSALARLRRREFSGNGGHPEPTKPTKPGFDGFEGTPPPMSAEIRDLDYSLPGLAEMDALIDRLCDSVGHPATVRAEMHLTRRTAKPAAIAADLHYLRKAVHQADAGTYWTKNDYL